MRLFGFIVCASADERASLQEEASYKLCKVKKSLFGKGAVPFIVVHDGRTIRYPDPDIKVRHSSFDVLLTKLR